jgi:hypothetical protein
MPLLKDTGRCVGSAFIAFDDKIDLLHVDNQ